MSKISSKFQVTVPKAIAERYGIQPGDGIRFEEVGESIRVVHVNAATANRRLDTEARLRLFDAATARQQAREAAKPVLRASTREAGPESNSTCEAAWMLIDTNVLVHPYESILSLGIF